MKLQDLKPTNPYQEAERRLSELYSVWSQLEKRLNNYPQIRRPIQRKAIPIYKHMVE